MAWVYDVYQHVSRPELRLVVRSGTDLPAMVPKSRWRYVGEERGISPIEAAEVLRSGFAISKKRETQN
jgi:hypothetical protein